MGFRRKMESPKNGRMMKLKRSILQEIEGVDNLILPTKEQLLYPEKVLQFGTGVLLRGLPDQYISEANRAGKFRGRVVVIKSTQQGTTDDFADQDGLYTLCVKGIDNGHLVNQAYVNASISRVLSATEDWTSILAFAKSEELSVVTSNTTEVGIVYTEENILDGVPSSFPGKLLAILHTRFVHYNGDPTKGLVIIPAELIEENGSKLADILNRLATHNQLGEAFIQWLNHANPICNTLVDRIVPGKLSAVDQAATEAALGYTDALMIMAEPFGLWAIESTDQRVIDALGFSNEEKGCIVVPSIQKFKELKLRMLNASHTFSCGVSILAGMEFVKDSMNHEAIKPFINQLALEEIAAAITGDKISPAEANAFGKAVLDRFANPFLEHKWVSIAAQFTLKMKIRCLPLIIATYEKKGELPHKMLIGFSAYLVQMNLVNSDDQATSLSNVLSDTETWGQDLTAIPGLLDKVLDITASIQSKGILQTIHQLT
jgi:tagaturonate reductase